VRDDHYDVIVAGGGPGGSTAAGRLVQRGRRVLLLERDEFPRFHLGESLLPMTLPVFDALGVTPKLDAKMIRKHGARFLDGTTGEEVVFKFAGALRGGHPHAFHGPRAEIDHILLEHAAGLGVEVRQRWEAVRFRYEGERVVGVVARGPDAAERELSARFVVDATGRDALASQRSGARMKVPHLERTLALFAHFDGCQRLTGQDEGDIRIVIVPNGWFWIIPFRGDRTSIGLVFQPDGLQERGEGRPKVALDARFRELCLGCDVVRDVMARATEVFPARAMADFSYRVMRLHGPGWLAVGDAAGFIDPLFSTGFHLAVKGADLAAEAVDQALATGDASPACFAPYERAVRGAAETYIGVVQAFYDRRLVKLLFETKKRTILRKMITSVLAGDVFYDEPPRWLSEINRLYAPQLALASSAGSDHVSPSFA
jgi:flavin-dependent dehydrogenase